MTRPGYARRCRWQRVRRNTLRHRCGIVAARRTYEQALIPAGCVGYTCRSSIHGRQRWANNSRGARQSGAGKGKYPGRRTPDQEKNSKATLARISVGSVGRPPPPEDSSLLHSPSASLSLAKGKAKFVFWKTMN